MTPLITPILVFVNVFVCLFACVFVRLFVCLLCFYVVILNVFVFLIYSMLKWQNEVIIHFVECPSSLNLMTFCQVLHVDSCCFCVAAVLVVVSVCVPRNINYEDFPSSPYLLLLPLFDGYPWKTLLAMP